MRVVIKSDAASVTKFAADKIAQLVRSKPDCVLGLATGSSPLGIYQELIRQHREEGLDFSQVTTFNLDEYVGLSGTDPQSYRFFMQSNLFDHINIKPANTNIPDGRALDFGAFCESYERHIVDVGGIDLQLLGIGADGHIAFNEPGSSLGSRTRLKTLTDQTVSDNARFFGHIDKVPRLAITMGIGTILESSQCVLVAMGDAKSEAIWQAIEGPVTAQVTASALQLHRDVVAVLDEGAACLLRRREYYDNVEQWQNLLETGQFNRLGIQKNDQ